MIGKAQALAPIAVGLALGAAVLAGLPGASANVYHRPPRPVPSATPTPTPTLAASAAGGTVPYPAALAAGHPFVTSYAPSVLAAAPWNDPQNSPGNCPADPNLVSLNSSGYAEIATTGQANNCTSIQSPGMLPTKPGYVYEADIYFSTFANWPAFWAYGNNWPTGGEIDAAEANFGVNYLSWHYGSPSDPQEISTNPWTYSGKTNAPTPVSPNITAPGWHVIDIAFTNTGVSVYYDGNLYDSIPESVTTAGDDPMWIAISEGSCEAGGSNVCASGALGTAGNVQVKYLEEFS